MRSQRHMVMTIVCDRSAFAKDVDSALRSSVSNFAFYVGSGDLLSVTTYDNDLRLVCPHSGKDRLNNLRDLFYGEAQGLSAPLRAAYSALSKFSVESKMDNVLVIISAGYDNSSLMYSAEDIVGKALRKKTTVMTIGVGDLADRNTLELISARTGGRYYQVDADSVSNITDILREINYGIHGAYVFTVPSASPAAISCEEGLLRLSLDSSSRGDNIPLFSDSAFTLPHEQLVCTFGYSSSSLSPSAMQQFLRLVTMMRDNTSRPIELISHSFGEGNDEAQRDLCVQRVRAIRSILIDSGIAPLLIRCRAMSDVRPVFPYPSFPWQEEYNRRVELRWGGASLFPFELVVEYVESEADAIDAVRLWSKRNFSAYYELAYVRQTPVFRVKLWGYQTESAARAAVELIKKKYNTSSTVE